MAFQGTQQKCKACNKTVYLVEQIKADGVIYHKSCFRCTHCKSTLKLGNYASLEGVLYCKPHFDQLLKTTGSFEKSFGSADAQDGGPKTTKQVISGDSNKEDSGEKKTATPSKFASHFSGTRETCVACNKTVYPVEKTSVEGLSYHKNCFKCVHGGCALSPSNYASLEGTLYCKHHYNQLFMEKGSLSNLTDKAPPVKAVKTST